MKASRTIVLLALLGIGGTLAAKPVRGELWETQLQVKSVQLGAHDMPAQRICQPAERERQNPRQWLGAQQTKGCHVADMKSNDKGMRWAMRCADGTSEGELRFIDRDRIEGQMQVKQQHGTFHMTFKGRRVGECNLDGETP